MKLIKNKLIKRLLLILFSVFLTAALAVIIINAAVTLSVKSSIVTLEEASEMTEVDCILVLGCFVRPDGSPSHMLEDRIKMGIELYKNGSSQKLLMSGDHGRAEYNEVGKMKECAIESGIPSYDIFMDHAGFSTYESLYRAKEIFGVSKIIIVTQEYHLYRALYIARSLGIEAYGVSSDYRTYGGQTMRDIREIAARVKDFGSCIIRPKPTYLGEKIPISGNGDATND